MTIKHIKLLIPNGDIGGIIGKGGSTLSQLRSDLQDSWTITLSGSSIFYPYKTRNSKDRILLLTQVVPTQVTSLNEVDRCMDALRAIYSTLYTGTTHTDINNNTVHQQIRLVLSSKLCGALFGKNGETIQSVRAQHPQVHILVADSEPGAHHERVLVVSSSSSSEKQQYATIDVILDAVETVIRTITREHHDHDGVLLCDGSMTYHSHPKFSSESASHSVIMSIPENRVGAVIGTQGSVTTAIQNILGVHMTITSHSNDNQKTSRECTISGNVQEAVTLAQRIVQLKIDGTL
jgi:predicted RNA-binding protein YlqC (UPF0109 family)